MSFTKVPQHQNKCYCRKGCSCNYDYMKNKTKTNFVKTDSGRQKIVYSPKIETKIIPKKVPSSEISSFTTRRQFYEFQKSCEFDREEEEEASKDVKPKSSFDFSKVEEISKFRSENSEDCISLSNKCFHDRLMKIRKQKNQSSSGHVCSHRYFLNERLFPEANLMNEMGDSLCTLCKKPSDYILDKKITPLNVVKKVLGKSTDEIDLTRGNPTLILEVKEDAFEKRKKVIRTELSNSLALRYQKRYYKVSFFYLK